MSSGNVSATEDTVSVSAVPLHAGVAVTGVAATNQSRGYRNAALCAVLVAVCLWIAWPVSKMGFLDDWSYARTAQIYAQTGHFVYNGWATAMLGWQIVWGALFIKLFGFSFTILRVSMLPIAMATVFLFHQILVRFGVNSRNAVIGTLTLGLSPLFLPLADSFMTDIPGLLVILICIYCCQRAIGSTSTRNAILWLVLAATSNVAGGTVRQIAWLGALGVVPTTGWMLRRRRGILPVTLALWAASAATIFLCMKWYARQPYSISEGSVQGLLSKRWAVILIPLDLGGAVLCSVLVLFPIVVAWLPTWRRRGATAVFKCAVVILVVTVLQVVFHTYLPWLMHLLESEFARGRAAGVAVPSPDTFLLPAWARVLGGAVVIATGFVLAVDLRASLHAGSWRKVAARTEVALLAPYLVAYFVLLVPRASIGALFDRYLLGVLPVFIPWVLLFFQARFGDRLPRLSVIWLFIFALLGIAGTHDWFAWQRARGAAMDEVLASGIPATEIQAGFEPDGWTQVQHGPINNKFVTIPAHEYRPVPKLDQIPAPCRLDFADRTPAIHAKYSIGLDPAGCFAPTDYPPVHYRRWLPPFHGTIYVQKLR